MMNDILNSIFFLLAIIVLCITTEGVINRVLEYRVIELSYQQKKDCEELWQPPTIPQCDKETWDRIREGCNNEQPD